MTYSNKTPFSLDKYVDTFSYRNENDFDLFDKELCLYNCEKTLQMNRCSDFLYNLTFEFENIDVEMNNEVWIEERR